MNTDYGQTSTGREPSVFDTGVINAIRDELRAHAPNDERIADVDEARVAALREYAHRHPYAVVGLDEPEGDESDPGFMMPAPGCGHPMPQGADCCISTGPAVSVEHAGLPSPDAHAVAAHVTAETAYLLPAPKGFLCAAGCDHSVHVHRTGGCDVLGCECVAPHGRILPGEEAPAADALRTRVRRIIRSRDVGQLSAEEATEAILAHVSAYITTRDRIEVDR